MECVFTLPLLCASPVQTAVSALEEGAGMGKLEMSIDRHREGGDA